MDSKHFHVPHTNTKKKRSENFPTCVGSFLVERREKNVEENSFKVVGKKKIGAKWQVAGNNLCMCGWTMGLERGVVDSVDTWQHFTFIVAVEDARSEGGGMHPKVPVTGGAKKQK